jgi:hypothetical protein
LLDDIDRNTLFHEMHRTIEEAATTAARELMTGAAEVAYPPNGGLLPDEIAALASIPRTPELESAPRKMLADAAAYPLFHLLCLADGVADPPELGPDFTADEAPAGLPLHDGLYESYWAWRRRRPDPGWRLDNFEGDAG